MSSTALVQPVSQYDSVPPELKVLDRWIMWTFETRKTSRTKIPRTVSGGFASVSDPSTWSSFDEVLQAVDTNKFSGIGLVLPEGMVGVDLDDVLIDGNPTQEAKMLLEMLPTYGEISPSGTGVKLIAAGHLSDDLDKICHAKGVELYDGGATNRYFAITGNVIDDKHSRITGQRESLHAIQTLISDALSPFVPDDGEDSESVDKALLYLSNLDPERADNYDDWLKVGMALSSVDKSTGMLQQWIEWSEQSSKFDGPKECERKWDSFRRENGRLIGLGWLERSAKFDGYAPGKYSTQFITASQLCQKQISREYLIEDLMVANEPMIFGGASKTLKTTIALDLAVSLATGTPFLHHFANLVGPRRVMFLSGESGDATIQENLKMIAGGKDIDPAEVHELCVGFKLPKLDSVEHVDDLIHEMKTHEIDIVFIDPLYRSLRVGEESANVYAMGEKLELISEKIHRAGITCVLLHHFRKQGRSYHEAPELEDLSQAGVAEFGRQFVLLKRRRRYRWDGNHTLWLRWGGSAGHQGGKMLEAYTGTRELGVAWSTTLKDEEEWKEEQMARAELEKANEVDYAKAEIENVIRAEPGIGRNELSIRVSVHKTRLKEHVESLARENRIEIRTEKRGKLVHFPVQSSEETQ